MGHTYVSTMSDSAVVNDTDALRNWYDQQVEETDNYFSIDVDDGEVTVYAETGIYIDHDDRFAEELSQFLEEPIKITTVSFGEGRFTSGTEWIIRPDGSTESTHIGQ